MTTTRPAPEGAKPPERRMRLFSVDVPIYATMYVRAETAHEALQMAHRAEGSEIEVSGTVIDGRAFAELIVDLDPGKDLTFSPAMTIGSLEITPTVEVAYDPQED